MPTILVCDDDAALREGLAEAIADLGHRVVEAADGHAALDAVAEGGIDAVLLDLRMPGPDGIEVLRRIRARPSPPPVAILTAVATAQNTIEAMRGGAVDHLAKPIGPDELADVLARMLQARPAAASPAAESPDADAFIGTSAAMRAVQKSIGLLADGNASVLVTGETGTGKEVVARALHAHGRRAPHPFVAVNCAAIPAELLESQLFGHARGAFTGATSDRTGSFREAHRGTLFLDEIGDMALPMQAKLLRVLQDRTVTPVGGPPVAIDVRIVSATHRDLADAVAQGRFREDLFYRLGVVPVALPPLRERLADLIPLAEHFLALASPDAPPRRLAPDAAARLLAHPWPGNVRELRNAVERSVALNPRPERPLADLRLDPFDSPFRPADARPPAREHPAQAADPAPERAGQGPAPSDFTGRVRRFETALLREALEHARFNQAAAARLLGLGYHQFRHHLRSHALLDTARPSAADADEVA